MRPVPATRKTRAGHAGRTQRSATLVLALVVAGFALACAGEAGNVLYGFGSASNAAGATLALRRTVLRAALIAVFLPLGLVLRRRGAVPALICAFAAALALFVGELLASPLLFQVAPELADLPSVTAAQCFQALTWLALLAATQGDAHRRAAAPAAWVGAVVALPKTAAAAVSPDVASLGFLPGSALSYLVPAGLTFALAALACAGILLAAGRRHRGMGPLAAPAPQSAIAPSQATAEQAEPAPPKTNLPQEEPSASDTAPVSAASIAMQSLSRREAEVFSLLSKGYTAKRIAQELFVSESTAQTHIKRIYAKFDVHSKQELIELVHSSHTGGAFQQGETLASRHP